MVLLKPKSRFKILRLLWGENFRIHLDERGSFVWNLLDGTLSVQEIARKLGEKFSLEDPLDRTEKFLSTLYRGGFVEFMEKIEGET